MKSGLCLALFILVAHMALIEGNLRCYVQVDDVNDKPYNVRECGLGKNWCYIRKTDHGYDSLLADRGCATDDEVPSEVKSNRLLCTETQSGEYCACKYDMCNGSVRGNAEQFMIMASVALGTALKTII